MYAAACLSAALIVAVPLPRMHGEPESTSWVGKTVIVMGTGVNIGQLTDTNQITEPLTPLLGLDYRVYGERGEFIQLKTREAVLGWTQKRNVHLVDDAVAYYSKQLEKEPNDITSLNHRGWSWAMKGEYLAGIADMTRAIAVSPASVFYNNRARIWGLKGDYDRALQDYDVAINMGADYLPLANRAKVWHIKKDYDKAIADFDQSLQMNPNYAAGYHHRGLAWHAKGDYDRAIADMTQAIRIDAKLAPALADRAVTWLEKRDHAKALADLNDAVRADPTCEPALALRGRLLTKDKAYAKALADLDEAIRLNSRYIHAFQFRAETLVRLKSYDKANADFERAAWLDDAKNADPAAALAFFLATCPDVKLRDGKRARTQAELAVKLDKSSANALEALAAAHAESNQFDEAVRVQVQALKGTHLQDADAARRRLELYRKRQPYRAE